LQLSHNVNKKEYIMRNFFSILVTLLLMGVSSSCSIEIGGDGDDSDFEGAGEKGVFSVSQTKRVKFSSGLLQYNPSEKKWRMASSQLEVLTGENADRFDSDFTGWIDLFSWSTPESEFGTIFGFNHQDRFEGEFVDWGKVLSESGWYTLSSEEWYYLLFERQLDHDSYLNAKVNGARGYVILPDNFVNPGVSYDFFSTNDFSTSEWSKMESAGAVFLPAAGFMREDDIIGDGCYCTSSSKDSQANMLKFSGVIIDPQATAGRQYGCAVRLVKPVD
jgi:hypothetical protein